MKNQIKREELYEKVWTKPMVQIAAEYGVSDVGMKKICKKLDVPTPPRGYWAVIQSGRKLSRAQLPKLRKGTPEIHTIQNLPQPASKKETKILLNFCPDSIEVPEKLTSPHPLIQNTRDALLKDNPDRYGAIRACGCLDVRIGPKSIQRAMTILDTLIKNLSDFEIKTSPNTMVVIDGEEVQFSLKESFRQIPHILTKREERYPLSAPIYDYIPTGILKLQIDEWITDGSKKIWSDTINMRLEAQLNDFIEGLGRIAYAVRQRRLEREEWKKQREEAKRMIAEEERLRLEEEEKRKDLENQALRWKQSRLIHNYLDEVVRQKQTIDQDWLLWARRYADTLNPIK